MVPCTRGCSLDAGGVKGTVCFFGNIWFHLQLQYHDIDTFSLSSWNQTDFTVHWVSLLQEALAAGETFSPVSLKSRVRVRVLNVDLEFQTYYRFTFIWQNLRIDPTALLHRRLEAHQNIRKHLLGTCPKRELSPARLPDCNGQTC